MTDTSQHTSRQPAVAGQFYPDNPRELELLVHEYLEDAQRGSGATEPVPRAIIAPHAGYIYSGPIAGSAYARLKPAHATIKRVVLFGPAHRVGFDGIATHTADEFLTPLGSVPLDKENRDKVLQLDFVISLDEAHSLEHCLEVHLPFLQEIVDEFTLLPMLVGNATPQQVNQVMELVGDDPETLIVVSSDLSHYHDYRTAQQMDQATSGAIEELNESGISYDQACGRIPVQGLIRFARQHNLHASTVDLRNSGDTAGPKDRVVGYGAYVFT